MMDIFFIVLVGLLILGVDYSFVVIFECNNSIVVSSEMVIEGNKI